MLTGRAVVGSGPYRAVSDALLPVIRAGRVRETPEPPETGVDPTLLLGEGVLRLLLAIPVPDVSPAALASHDLAGRRAPHAWFATAGRMVSTLDLFGDRLTVLPAGRGPDSAERPGAGDARPRLHRPDETFGAAYALGRRDALVVRPDGYVAWGGPMDGVRAAVAAVTGSPSLVTASGMP